MSRKLTTQEFIERSIKVHGDKYDYSLSVYINSATEVIIICPHHGQFKQLSQSHYQGKGCRKCGSKKSATTNTGLSRCNITIKIGDKFNKLTILERLQNNEKQNSIFKCICECGEIKNLPGSMVKNGYIKSCGCLQKEVMFNRRTEAAIYNVLYRSIRTDCKKRNIPFNITVSDIKDIVNKKCVYCNREPYDKKCRNHTSNSSLEGDCLILHGIDRVIPNLGYTIGNVVTCCKYCNRAKSDLSLEDFKNLITLIFENYVKTSN